MDGTRGRAEILTHFSRSADLTRQTGELVLESVLSSINLIAECYRSGHKLLICGNGGSAADAQHMAAEFMNRMRPIVRPGLPAIALTTDTSFLTSFANDNGYEGVFERQVLALGESGDILI